ncbi:GNAT family N-acetyltransferase [Intrasporangium sp.]|uniref:GNAT family N-acetyltransferase n=1 Tax=Intrasporangium sp. TaxID=1925024 RepID=UPI00336593F6
MELARLLCLNEPAEQPQQDRLDAFALELAAWWAGRGSSHRCFTARTSEGSFVGMAWLAVFPRVPRPGNTQRLAADIQTVFVRPEWRGQGIGSALVQAAVDHAEGIGVVHTTVHSGRRVVPVYERLGFESSPQLLQRTPSSRRQS